MGDRELSDVQSLLDRLLAARPDARILEAGCGSTSMLRFSDDARLIGIDISRDQLDRNTRLHEKILGDVESYPLPSSSFDAIVCWDVLEHLPHPERALANFARSVRPGGLILLAFPNPGSFKGWLTRVTPHAFHVWVYRNVFGIEWAGKPGHGPFETLFRPGMHPARLRAFAREHALDVAYERLFEGPGIELFVRRHPLPGSLYRGAMAVLSAGTLGRVRAEQSDGLFVLARGGSPAAKA
jgi:SAM-dependent methyltransferase